MSLFITILMIVFAVWLVGLFFGWFQTAAGSPQNMLFLLLAILLAVLVLRELGLFSRRGRLLCTDHQRAVQGLLSPLAEKYDLVA